MTVLAAYFIMAQYSNLTQSINSLASIDDRQRNSQVVALAAKRKREAPPEVGGPSVVIYTLDGDRGPCRLKAWSRHPSRRFHLALAPSGHGISGRAVGELVGGCRLEPARRVHATSHW
jgi:hypothetical protein